MTAEGEIADHGDGENYFVSMTDMMVGMLFVFIIMLMGFVLMFQQKTEVQVDKIQVAKDIGDKLTDLERQVARGLKQITDAAELRWRLIAEIKNALNDVGIIVTEADDVLRFNENAIEFDSRSSDLKPIPRGRVETIAGILSRVLPKYLPCRNGIVPPHCQFPTSSSLATMFIEGHTDRTGQDNENWTLSAQRAAKTYRTMTEWAPGLRSLRNRDGNEILSISGYSSTRPIVAETTEQAKARNRRIDLRFLMDTDPTAGLNEITRLLSDMQAEIARLRGDGR